MEQWTRQWLWPAVILLVLAWGGAFAISFIVAESKTSDGDDVESQPLIVHIDTAAEWVSCQAGKTAQLGRGPGTLLPPNEVIRIRNECQIGSEAWVLCADEEFSKLSEQEFASFTSSIAVEITEVCRERLGGPGEPIPTPAQP